MAFYYDTCVGSFPEVDENAEILRKLLCKTLFIELHSIECDTWLSYSNNLSAILLSVTP